MNRRSPIIFALLFGLSSLPAQSVAAPADLDADFGACGVARAGVGVATLLPLADGRILTVGDGLARHHRDGRLDRRFGSHGVVVGDGARYVAAALQPDGKIVAVRSHDSGADSDVAIQRWLPDGSPDPTFGNAGVDVARIAGSNETPSALAIQADGKLVVAGMHGSGAGSSDAFLLRRLLDGGPDGMFGAGGALPTMLGIQGAPALALQADGRLVTAAIRNVPFDDDYFIVERRRDDGSLDPGFGVAGVARLAADGTATFARAMAIQPNGAIVVAGDSQGDWQFARLLPDGSPDSTFGRDGLAHAFVFFDDAHLFAFVTKPDGALVMVGAESEGNGIILKGLLADGNVDPSFPENPAIYLADGDVDGGRAVALTPDGKLIIGAFVDGAPALVRFLGDCAGARCRSCPRCIPHPNFCGTPKRARLRLTDGAEVGADTAMWRWSGDAVPPGLGNPEHGYFVSLWDGCEQVAAALVGEATTCGEPPCWETSARRSSYQDASFSLRLRTDVHGFTSVALASKDGLAFPAPQGPLTVVVANQNSRYPCWQAFFDRVRKSGAGTFHAETSR